MSAADTPVPIATATPTPSLSVFQTKYDEFAKELLETFPEFAPHLAAAVALPPDERLRRFQAEVKVAHISDKAANPGTFLPGVVMPDATWASLSVGNQSVLWEYLRLLSMCCFLEGGFGAAGLAGATGAGVTGDGSGDEAAKGFFEEVMGEWKSKLETVDFEGLMGKFATAFPFFGGGGAGGAGAGAGAGTDASGGGGFKMPKLPEKLLKGHLAKLAEEIVKDIKPEDLGLTPEMMAECETNPAKAFELLIQTFTRNPTLIQSTIQKIGKRLQHKIQTGAIRPQEIAREAEELMKEFSENEEFVELMSTFKSAFGFEDMGLARQTGKEQSARMAMVKERLRRKLDSKKGTTEGAAGGAGATNTVVEGRELTEADWTSILADPKGGDKSGDKSGSAKQAKKGKKK